MVGLDGGTEADIKSRIKKAKGAFAQLRTVWTSRQILRQTKMRIFKSNVMTVLLYGCEIWKINIVSRQTLKTHINRCLRYILTIWWSNTIRNEDLWRITEQEPIKNIITRRRWRWIGHILRRPHRCIAGQALEWNPQGSRKRERPKNTWKRTIMKDLEKRRLTWREAKAL